MVPGVPLRACWRLLGWSQAAGSWSHPQVAWNIYMFPWNIFFMVKMMGTWWEIDGKMRRIFSIKWKQRVHLNNNYCFVFFNNVHRNESIIVFKVDWHCWKSILSQQWIGNTTAWTKDTCIWYYTVNPLSLSHHSRDDIWQPIRWSLQQASFRCFLIYVFLLFIHNVDFNNKWFCWCVRVGDDSISVINENNKWGKQPEKKI